MSTQQTNPVHPEPETFPEVPEPLGESESSASAALDATAPMPHVEYSYSPEAFVCVRCGSTNLAHGYIVDYGEKFEQIRFAPKRITLRWLNSILALRPWRSLAKVNAEACRDCGAVLLVVEPDELRRAERRRD
jgi:uncharacterized protein with von Willebrand factor type A (vWA) domain